METVDRWLKSLRLHKYTQIFRQLTYEQMLSIDEKFLIDLDITKGARNKILVSVKKLNLRHDRLANMEDDLNQDNISMKEALSLMKDMLITPIPKPLDESMPPSPTISLPESSLTSPESTTSSSGASSTTSGFDYTDAYSMTSTGSTPTSTPTIPVDSPNTTITSSLNQDSPYTAILAAARGGGGGGGKTSIANSFYTNPYELTYLFVETFEKLAQRLIDSGGFEDNACHGIMAGIVDECSKHNSFTEEQKARMARFKKPIMAKGGGGGRCYPLQQSTTRDQKIKMVGFRHQHQPHYPSIMRQSYQQQQRLPQQHQQITQHQYYTPPPPPPAAPRPPQNQYHSHSASHHSHSNPHHVIQRKNVNIWNYHSSATPYREYSLLGPGITFELPCLRAKAEAEKHNRRQFGFFTDNSGSSSSSGSSVSSSD